MKIMSNAARPVYISTIKPGVPFGVKNPSRKNGPGAEMMTAMKIKMNDGRVAVIDMSTGHELPEDAVKTISYEPVEEACLETSKAARIGTIRPRHPVQNREQGSERGLPVQHPDGRQDNPDRRELRRGRRRDGSRDTWRDHRRNKGRARNGDILRRDAQP